MDTLIQIWIADRKLSVPFQSSSGTLKMKRIIQVTFSTKNKKFVFELPLSPSCGEMPDDLIHLLHQHKEEAFEKSTHLKRTITYFKAHSQNFPGLAQSPPMEVFKIVTYGVGAWPIHKHDHLVKIKASNVCLDALIEWTQNTQNRWSVDFNGTLSLSDWEKFSKRANFILCQWIEQPLPTGILTHSLIFSIDVPVFADEEMKYLKTEDFLHSPFRGFILKPLNHDYNDLVRWISLAQKHQIPCIIGTPVCDIIGLSFCDFINRYLTVQLSNIREVPFFEPPNIDKDFFYEKTAVVNRSFFDFIADNYDVIFSYPLYNDKMYIVT